MCSPVFGGFPNLRGAACEAELGGKPWIYPRDPRSSEGLGGCSGSSCGCEKRRTRSSARADLGKRSWPQRLRCPRSSEAFRARGTRRVGRRCALLGLLLVAKPCIEALVVGGVFRARGTPTAKEGRLRGGGRGEVIKLSFRISHSSSLVWDLVFLDCVGTTTTLCSLFRFRPGSFTRIL